MLSSTVSLVSSTASSAESESFACYNDAEPPAELQRKLSDVREEFDGGTYESFLEAGAT